MAQENRSARQRPGNGGDPAPETPGTDEVPEADAAEQRAPAGDDDTGNGWDDPSAESFELAAEADVVEQALEAGGDEDERR